MAASNRDQMSLPLVIVMAIGAVAIFLGFCSGKGDLTYYSPKGEVVILVAEPEEWNDLPDRPPLISVSQSEGESDQDSIRLVVQSDQQISQWEVSQLSDDNPVCDGTNSDYQLIRDGAVSFSNGRDQTYCFRAMSIFGIFGHTAFEVN